MKAEFKKIATEILSILTTSGSPPEMDGTMSARVYPPHESEQRLGPHVDNTTLTLLWANAPGLQIPVKGSIEPGTVSSYGIPNLTGEFVILSEAQWMTIPAHNNDIILTLGLEFFEHFSGEKVKGLEVESPVLHRVKVGGEGTRVSVPYLCRVKVEEGGSGDNG